MSSLLVRAVAILLALWAAWPAAAAELGVLQPLLQQGKPLQKKDPQGRLAPVVTRLREGTLYEQLQREAQQGFTRSVLALDDAAQRAAGAKVLQPTWLYLSAEDGGFPRFGFWLREGKRQRYVAEHYVDLVVDENSVADGSFEEIFAHEMGHVFLRRVFPRLPEGWSRTPHHSFSVTDYPTAFDEGFGTHMQGLARRFTRNPRLQAQDLGLENKALVNYWLSNVDRTLRIDGVRRNLFVQAQITLPGATAALARRDLSSLFDPGRLKNGQQMLSCEGVLATLFHRWLVPGEGDEVALVQRYSAFFASAAALNRDKPGADAPLFPALLEHTVRAASAEEAARLVGLYIDTTYGASADAAIARQVEALATVGGSGDIEAFVPALKASRESLAKLRDAALQSPNLLRAALGPELWLAAGGDERGTAKAKDAEDSSFVNLNTAELEHLLLLPGLDEAQAQRALQSRREQGPFRDLADFVARSGVPDAAALEAAQRHARKAGPHSRR